MDFEQELKNEMMEIQLQLLMVVHLLEQLKTILHELVGLHQLVILELNELMDIHQTYLKHYVRLYAKTDSEQVLKSVMIMMPQILMGDQALALLILATYEQEDHLLAQTHVSYVQLDSSQIQIKILA